MSKVLLIIPAYNEEKNLPRVLKDLRGLKLPVDILVVNDGSSDGTEKAARENGVRVVSHLYNLGYGCALQTGFKYALEKQYDFVIQFDADGQHRPEYIRQMIEELERGSGDIIIGSRFMNSSIFKAGVFKAVLIKLMQFLIRISTKAVITDPTSGFKGLSKQVYSFYSRMDNFPHDYPDADVIIRMIRLKYTVKEMPISIMERSSGKSMHSGLKPLVYALNMMLSVIMVLVREAWAKEV